jgi:hypothetical protein
LLAGLLAKATLGAWAVMAGTVAVVLPLVDAGTEDAGVAGEMVCLCQERATNRKYWVTYSVKSNGASDDFGGLNWAVGRC